MNIQQGFFLAAVVAFVLGGFAAGGWPWLYIGSALFVAGHIGVKAS
jgi:hypothetical protein